MGISYEKMYEIHYYECDKNLNCTLESIMNFLGDVGNKHAESLQKEILHGYFINII